MTYRRLWLSKDRFTLRERYRYSVAYYNSDFATMNAIIFSKMTPKEREAVEREADKLAELFGVREG